MGHRTQIILTDQQYARLLRESERTGVSLAELVRRAVDATFPDVAPEDALERLDRSFGSWRDRDFDGAAYVEGLRRGMSRRLAS